MDWPDAVSPHRASEGTDPRGPCPHCDARAWIDLRRESTALAIRQGEDGNAVAASPITEALSNAALGVIVGAFVGLLGTTTLAGGAAVALLAGAAAGLTTYRQRQEVLPPRPPLPDRWALALPPASPATTVVRGVAQCGDRLRSPLTGRTCIAYEVGLRRDDDVHGELPTWALLEQRVAPIRIGDTTLSPESVFVELPRESLGQLSPEDFDEPAIAWLRERGFSVVGSPLIAYESVLVPEADVVAELSDQGARLRPKQDVATL